MCKLVEGGALPSPARLIPVAHGFVDETILPQGHANPQEKTRFRRRGPYKNVSRETFLSDRGSKPYKASDSGRFVNLVRSLEFWCDRNRAAAAASMAWTRARNFWDVSFFPAKAVRLQPDRRKIMILEEDDFCHLPLDTCRAPQRSWNDTGLRGKGSRSASNGVPLTVPTPTQKFQVDATE